MPHATLYLSAGSNGNWVDAFDAYGLSLSDAGLSQLMTPAPNKDPITNNNIISDGVNVMQEAFYKDARQVSLDVHVTAKTKQEFMLKYANFCTEILNVGYFKLQTIYQPGRVYRFYYQSCNQYTEFRQQIAKFTLSLLEPNPNYVEEESNLVVVDSEDTPIDDVEGSTVTTNRIELTIAQLNMLLTGYTDNQTVDTIPEAMAALNNFFSNATVMTEVQLDFRLGLTIDGGVHGEQADIGGGDNGHVDGEITP